jgi:fibronectin type 3 domain-containing protein
MQPFNRTESVGRNLMTSTTARMIFCLSLALPLVSCSSDGSNEPAGSTPAATATASAQFQWDPNTETDLAGYKIYQGTSSGQYGPPVATLAVNNTSYEATGLQKGSTYFFAVAAFDISGNEGPLSAELAIPIS